MNANVLAVDALSTIDEFESAEELFLKSLNDLESAVDDGGSKGRGIVGALRKMRVAAAGMSASSGAIKFTFSAGGFVAPFYVTVYGLTERELPRAKTESGIRIVEIKGFCVGSSVGKRNAM